MEPIDIHALEDAEMLESLDVDCLTKACKQVLEESGLNRFVDTVTFDPNEGLSIILKSRLSYEEVVNIVRTEMPYQNRSLRIGGHLCSQISKALWGAPLVQKLVKYQEYYQLQYNLKHGKRYDGH